ncbi:hypothetical protein ACFQ9Z_24720 [Streptomyces sp. NPDC056580]|uniref:hypothetical protein n=1 Tax=Streptomyces sp. NPDC056580 TaxID=3345872 RepID=UPI0036B0E3AE
MPQTEGQLTQSGRLFAALAVLRQLARPERELLTPDAAPNPKDSPEIRIGRVRVDLYEALTKIRGRGGEHWKAASEIFQSIPGFLTAGPVPSDNINDGELARHRAGYEAQLAEYKEKWPQLFT